MKTLHIIILLALLLPVLASAQTPISGYTSQSSPAAADLLVTVDVSDTTMAATGTTKKMALSVLDLYFAGTTQTLSGKSISGSSNTFTNIPISTAISGLGSGVATWLATPSSANLASAVTGETGSGALVFGTSPTLTTPNLGTPSTLTLTNATGLPVSTGISGLGTGIATWLATSSSANLATAVTDETGSGALVFGTSPTLTTPNLGTPSAINLANATNLPGSIQKIRQVVVVTPKTDTASGSNNPPTWAVAHSGTITTTAADSKVIVVCCANLGNSGATFATFARLERSGSPLAQGDAAGSRTRTFISVSPPHAAIMLSATLVGSDTPGSAAAHTYDLAIAAESTSTWYLNRSGNDADNAAAGRSASTMFLIEVAP